MLRSGLSKKRRGTLAERAVAKMLSNLCGESFRVKGSGAIEGLPGDVMARLTDRRWQIEVKSRKTPPKVVLGWLGGSDALFILPEGGEVTVTMRFDKFAELVSAAQSPAAPAGGAISPPASPATRWPKRPFQRRVA